MSAKLIYCRFHTAYEEPHETAQAALDAAAEMGEFDAAMPLAVIEDGRVIWGNPDGLSLDEYLREMKRLRSMAATGEGE